MQKSIQDSYFFSTILIGSLLCVLPLTAAATPTPVIDIEAPIITNTATDLSIPVLATPTAPNLTPIVTPSLDSSVDGIVKAGIKVTDKVVATDTETTFTFKPTGKIGPLGPGQHTITWTATDLGLNNSTPVSQTITVLPSVNLSLDQEVGEGGTATVTAHLNGKAPSYPVTIPYTVVNNGTTDAADHNASNGDFVFAANETSSSISFSIVDDGPGDSGETFNINLGALPATQVFAGHQISHQITITETNLAPLAQLHAEQNNKTTRIITTDAGKVTICAMPVCATGAYDANEPNDTNLNYDWSASDNALVPTTGTTGKVFEFEPQELNPGFYTIRLTVSDSDNNASAHDLLLYLRETGIVLTEADSDDDKIKDNDALESYYDKDNDGIPNYLDAIENNPSLMQAYEPYLFDSNLKIEDSLSVDSITLSWQLSSSVSNLTVYPLLIATSPGLHLNIGPTAFAATKTYARLETSAAENLRGANVDEGLISSDGQVIDIEITNLNSVGDSALIVLPQAAPIPASKSGTTPQFIIFKNTKTWGAFTADVKNEIKTKKEKLANSYCPGLNDTVSYTDSLATGDECLLINIEDGGPNDYDGVANGTIRLMGSIFITSDSVADTNQTTGGTFTGNTDSALEGQDKLNLGTGSGGGSLGFISLFALLLTTVIRRFSHKNQ